MGIHFTTFNEDRDFERINDFLFSLYKPGNRDGNWVQPIWEYSYTHAWADMTRMTDLGIWEDNGRIAAFIFYDTELPDLTLAVHPDYQYLKSEMTDYAEKNLFAQLENGEKLLRLFVADFDTPCREMLSRRGYTENPDNGRAMSWFDPKTVTLETVLPEGFRFKSLEDDNDLEKIDRCLHRGFNHSGEPPSNGVAGRLRMQSGPHFRKDLNIVVEAPDGEFVSFAGLWFDEINKFGYVEPVATDPLYRRRGLGRAAVMESIRRCCELGAEGAWVWTDMGFYLSFGFRTIYRHLAYEKTF